MWLKAMRWKWDIKQTCRSSKPFSKAHRKKQWRFSFLFCSNINLSQWYSAFIRWCWCCYWNDQNLMCMRSSDTEKIVVFQLQIIKINLEMRVHWWKWSIWRDDACEEVWSHSRKSKPSTWLNIIESCASDLIEDLDNLLLNGVEWIGALKQLANRILGSLSIEWLNMMLQFQFIRHWKWKTVPW